MSFTPLDIVGILSLLASIFVYYRAKKRKANAEADTLEITNELTEVDRLEARLKQRDDKVDAIYVELRKVES